MRQVLAVFPEDLAVLRLNFSAAFSFSELAQRLSNKRGTTSKSRGGARQLIQEFQGDFVNSHSNSFHIVDGINGLDQFQYARRLPLLWGNKVIK